MKNKYIFIFIILVILLSVKALAGEINGFRIAYWNYSKTQVKEGEKSILVEEGEDYLTYIGSIYSYNCIISYNFTDNKLTEGTYIIPSINPYSSFEECKNNYKKINTILIQKHGRPTYEGEISRNIINNYFAEIFSDLDIFRSAVEAEIWLDPENTASVISLIVESKEQRNSDGCGYVIVVSYQKMTELVFNIINLDINNFVMDLKQYTYKDSEEKRYTFDTKKEELTWDEEIRFYEIVTNVMQNPYYLTSKIHREFWGLLNKLLGESISIDDVEFIKNFMVGIVAIYPKEFFTDALWALKTGRPFKSASREQLEKELLSLGVIAEWRIKENERLIEKISKHEPIPFEGDEIILTEFMVELILENLDEVVNRINILFSKP
jgi:hypothetical protein